MARYNSIWDGPGRNYSKDSDGDPIRTRKEYIVIHNTSNDGTAEEEASYAKRRTDSVSSHYYVDNNSIRQSLDTDWRAWHVGSDEGNDAGISYEITGTNGKSRSWWLANVAWTKLIAQIRMDCDVHGIVPRALTIGQIQDGSMSGIITHDQARRAWGGTDHTDPGENFPMDHLIEQAKEDEMELTDRVDYTAWYNNVYDEASGTVEATIAATIAYARNASDKVVAARAEQAVQTALLRQLAASQSDLTEAEVAAAVEEGIRRALPSAEEIAEVVAAAVDHELDVAAVVAALREFYGAAIGTSD